MHTDAEITRLLDSAFSDRDAAGLTRLLGFDAQRTPVPALRDALPHLIEAGLRAIHLRGNRGTLFCYELSTTRSPHVSDLPRITRALRSHNLAQLQLYVLIPDDWAEIVIATFGLGDQLLTLTLGRGRTHAADFETLRELIPDGDERGSALAARHARALDRARITRRFFADFAAQRDCVARAWTAIGERAHRDRAQLALLLLSRLMFLYFLQHRGYLADDPGYLMKRLRAWRSSRTFYAGALKPLFFFVLNRRPERRPARARVFGDLPYLNGGLFERHLLERKYAHLDLDDGSLTRVFEDLLERYRFTASEAADAELDGVHDVGVDPEMLGRVFEGLMAARVRETTGTYYTPARTVDKLVRSTLVAHLAPRIGERTAAQLIHDGVATGLDAYQRRFTSSLLRETRVLDPACGSGAFLLGALSRLAQTHALLDDVDVMAARREAVARSLYGVDVQSDAALLCALRLWLALVPGGGRRAVQPLPNLDRQIRQGDSLIDPLDLRAAVSDARIRRCITELQPASTAYVTSEPEQRPVLQRALARVERRLAVAWIGAHQRRIAHETAELHALAHQKDLFGSVTAEALAARAALIATRQRAAELRRLARDIHKRNERPFFSYAVHFPDAALRGFDIVLCNPPWVRSHNWPRTITRIVKQRFQVCRGHRWQPPHAMEIAAGGGNQIDLALLFLERALDLLAPGGVLGVILPAKFMRSLSGAAARALLLERAAIVSIEDHSLDQRSIFAADAFASVIVARKLAPSAVPRDNPIEVTNVRRGAAPLTYTMRQRELSLFQNDARAPWLLVPPDARRALLRMQQSPLLGAHRDLRVRRGVVTGANDLLLLTRAERKLGDLTAIQSEGWRRAANPLDYEGVVESEAVKPVLRGCDVGAWTCRRERFLLCRSPHSTSAYRRLAAYLSKHGRNLGDVPKLDAARPLLAWHDLASTLKAVVVTDAVVALNTVYFIPIDEERAYILCAYFNSLPVRTYARAIAERAKDAHFRFFAWTMSLLPLPERWQSFEAARLRELSRAAHAAGTLGQADQAELDDIIARAFSLTRSEMSALAAHDAWLRGT